MTDSPDVGQLQKELRTLQLKLQHYRQKVVQQEDQIADLRVEVTDLQEQAQSNVQEFFPQPPEDEPLPDDALSDVPD